MEVNSHPSVHEESMLFIYMESAEEINTPQTVIQSQRSFFSRVIHSTHIDPHPESPTVHLALNIVQRMFLSQHNHWQTFLKKN